MLFIVAEVRRITETDAVLFVVSETQTHQPSPRRFRLMACCR